MSNGNCPSVCHTFYFGLEGKSFSRKLLTFGSNVDQCVTNAKIRMNPKLFHTPTREDVADGCRFPSVGQQCRRSGLHWVEKSQVCENVNSCARPPPPPPTAAPTVATSTKWVLMVKWFWYYLALLGFLPLWLTQTTSSAAAAGRERLSGRESWAAKTLRKMSIRGRSVIVINCNKWQFDFFYEAYPRVSRHPH